MNTLERFASRPLRRTLATALFAVACGVALPAMAQPAGGYGPGAGPGPGAAQRMGPGWGQGMGPGTGPGWGHRMGDGMGQGLGMMPGWGMERGLDAIGASADQKAKIVQIMQAARSDLQAQRDARLKLRDQARSIFAAPTVDARAAEALRQQMLAQHDAASKRMLQAMLDASAVLTPDQRKALAERMATRQAMMQRHRAERATLDGAPRKP
ncbi:MAG: Spy/CpxP family protein refolding chaperone [Rubrivivax sp.]